MGNKPERIVTLSIARVIILAGTKHGEYIVYEEWGLSSYSPCISTLSRYRVMSLCQAALKVLQTAIHKV